MLSTNQKAKMIYEKIHNGKQPIMNLIDFKFVIKDKLDLSKTINTLKEYYNIDVKKSIIILPGYYLIHPVQFDDQIDKKFIELKLKEE